MELNTLLLQADSLRFKLLGIVGHDEAKKKRIIEVLTKDQWTLIDVESEMLPIRAELDAGEPEVEFEVGTKIKEWFNSKPNKLILTNASILYHELFLKISPVGAFKYNSRNKNCVLFLEDEEQLGSRLYHGQVGKDDYYDQEIKDIILKNIQEIEVNYSYLQDKKEEYIIDPSKLSPDAIGNLFNFQQIKDVVDIDTDLKETNKKKELVASYVISDSLEMQILEFFDNLEKPNHKANTIIGNYGSGKSHLIGFLISLVEEPSLADMLVNEKIKKAVKKVSRKFLTVQFELQSGEVELRRWFFGKIKKQLKTKYGIEVPTFDPKKNFDDKENIGKILEIIKKDNPSIGLLVVIDEISDSLAAKQKEAMKADLQFIRVIGQVCQDQDLMFIGSMQEDIFTSPKFKDVASEVGRISERSQYIIIHKEDIKKVISTRIVPKNAQQKHVLEEKMKPFMEKINEVSRKVDEYIDLFPLTPFLLELFGDLPYFEKRGAIQFAIAEIKYLLNEKFPYFITFDKIYNLLENNPNKRNLEEIYEITKVMSILTQKINLLDPKFHNDALKVVKGLAVYSLWNKKQKGATPQELANNLMLLPQQKTFSAADHISLIIKKIRDVTDGEYIKITKDDSSGVTYFRFDTKAGIDPEQKIAQKASPVSGSEMEYELFFQLGEILELNRVNGHCDVFEDECEWKSVKSFRRGYIIFVKEDAKFAPLPKRDYAVAFISPLAKKFSQTFAHNQLTIQLNITNPQNIELLKEIVAIKQLINDNFQKHIMTRKLDGRINGYSMGSTQITGLKYRLSKLLMNAAEYNLNGQTISIKSYLGREHTNVLEIIENLKTAIFDNPFNKLYPLHPSYSIQLSSRNIIQSLTSIALDLTKGDFSNLNRNTHLFLNSINLLDSQGYPDTTQSKHIQKILDILKANNQKVTDIDKELLAPLSTPDYGLEPEVIHFLLIFLTVQGKVILQVKGGDKIDINNIKEKFKSIAAFETIAYAKLQENYSYDFASRLFNTLGLNGAKITIEKERLNAFREYKEKINSIIGDISTLEDTINYLRQKPKLYINIEKVQKNFIPIQEIEWKKLGIDNYTQFGRIESFNPHLHKITIRLKDLRDITDALKDYQELVHDAIIYMNGAIELLQKSPQLVTDNEKFSALKEYTSIPEQLEIPQI